MAGNLLAADGMTAEVDGKEIMVTKQKLNILNKPLSYLKNILPAQIIDKFWRVESETILRAVDVYITKLRDKFSVCDGFEIKTVRDLEYKAMLL